MKNKFILLLTSLCLLTSCNATAETGASITAMGIGATITAVSKSTTDEVTEVIDTPTEDITTETTKRPLILNYMGTVMPLSNTPTDIVGTDDTGVEYTYSDIAYEPVILIYTDWHTGYEMRFQGTIDEKGYWYGAYTLNGFEGDTLRYLLEATLVDGELTGSYVQIEYIPEKDWYNFSERNYETTDGVTGSYKTFKIEDPSYIIRSWQCYPPDRTSAFYAGKLNNGLFDTNGERASYHRSDDADNIITYYVGAFKEGRFYDMSGDAFWLSWDGNKYVYYRGNFDGIPTESDRNIFYDADEIPKEIMDKLSVVVEINDNNRLYTVYTMIQSFPSFKQEIVER